MKRKSDSIPLLLFFLFVLGTLGLFIGTAYQHFGWGAPIEPQYEEALLQKEEFLITAPNGKESVRLKAGTRVRIAAYHCKNPHEMLIAESPDGLRGVLAYTLLPVEPEYGWNDRNGRYVMAADQFYGECVGKTFEEFDGKYRRAIFVPQHPSKCKEVIVSMPFLVRLPSDWKAYEPQVKYVDGVATEVTYKRIRAGNTLILRYAPMSDWLIDQPWVQRLVSKPQFVKREPLREHDSAVVRILSYPIRWVGLFLYLSLMGVVPMVLLFLLLLTPLLRFIGNKPMLAILIVVGVASTYLWWIISMIEGFGWWYAWFPALCSLGFNLAIIYAIMRCRCEKCRRIAYLRLIESTFLRRFAAVYEQVEYDSDVSYSYEPGTKRTTEKRGDKVVHEWDEKVRVVRETTRNYKNTYELTYDVKEYHNKYRCPYCHHLNERDEQDRTLTSKRLVKREQSGKTEDIYEDTRRR